MKSGDAADRLERPDRAVDAARQDLLRAVEQLDGLRESMSSGCRHGGPVGSDARRHALQRARGLARVVGDDDVGAGAADRRQDSIIARGSSIQPLPAAALSIAYSPLTW
jgi:hypothetical protein